MFDVNHPVEELFTEKEQQNLSGIDWSNLLQNYPQFEKFFTEKFRQKLDGLQWCLLLEQQSHFEKYFQEDILQKLDGDEWSCLLKSKPHFVRSFRKEFQQRLNGFEWCDLLEEHPQFISLDPDQYKFVLNCGENKRAVWIDVENPLIIHIGCFYGSKAHAIRAISEKYSGEERDTYIAKVNECFDLVK